MGLMVLVGALAYPGGGGMVGVAFFVILVLASGCFAMFSFLAGSRLPQRGPDSRIDLARSAGIQQRAGQTPDEKLAHLVKPPDEPKG